MDATLYTGTGTTQVIVNQAQFKPDLLWQKVRNSAGSHYLADSVRGVANQLSSNNTNAEGSIPTFVTSFNSNGWTNGTGNYTASDTVVGWQWQAGQGSTSSNTSGTITSTTSVSTTAGFSIVTYTTPSSGNYTVGHGLGVQPAMIINKARGVSSAVGWGVWHKGLTGGTSNSSNYLLLNSTAAQASFSGFWGAAAPTSTVFGMNAGVSATGADTQVAYCWSEIAGFSSFGSYTGNGSTDGNFVYLGFRPKFILFKNTSIAEGWNLRDTSRDTYNASQYELYPNSSAAEGNASARSPTTYLDILSNGFKLRTNNAEFNNGTGTNVYIYMAFAENPFKNANAR
jgi:hypothetical protein